ncbi:TatD family hydrolase [Polaribacter sargassicola]|uniref:TatD family hydrolase n=1 Tax=Polaribacter sargassicola TaxID=2836891 RepID=UPI001F006260|nr:TatD family hydrolase [Polaribacter sp. DS7-9]MCG1036214.1 TatD family hydrolase [Polaribacter sp. DS7-9]
MVFIDVHTHAFSERKKVFSIVNTYPDSKDFSKPFSIGIHPWFIKKEQLGNQLSILEDKLQSKNCFALGECGLDKLTDVNFELQKEVLIKQIQLSEKYQKPLIIHCVKAHQEIIALKKEMKPKQVWILHGFNKSIQLAESCVKNGILLSFGAAIIANKKLQETFLELPLASILLETDDNEVAIEEVYKKAASIRKINIDELQQEIKQNFNTIFI